MNRLGLRGCWGRHCGCLVFGGGAGDHLFAVDERVVTVQGLLDGVVDFGVGSINAVVFVEVIGF